MKRIIIVVYTLLICLFTYGQNPIIKVEAPALVAVGETFSVTFIIESNSSIKSFQWSEGDDFLLHWGPQKGSSTNISAINGHVTKTVSKSYTYMLSIAKIGKFKLPSATIKIKGKTYKTEERLIEAVENQEDTDVDRGDANNNSVNLNEVFLRITVDKKNVIVGEPLHFSLKLYTRMSLSGVENFEFSKLNDFWSQELYTASNIDFHREKYKNKIYNVALLRKYILIPQHKGKLEISPAKLTCLINVPMNNTDPSDIFDAMLGTSMTTVRKQLVTKPIIINVKDIPSSNVDNFKGAVGDFKLDVRLSKKNIKQHEAVSLIVTIKGEGNLPLLEAPNIKFPADFELYDSKIEIKLDKENNPIKGEKIFEYPFIPRLDGSFELPEISYSYYDIKEKQIKTLKPSAIKIDVEKSDIQNSLDSNRLVVGNRSNRKIIKILDNDIRFIHIKKDKLVKSTNFLWGGTIFYILLTLFLLSSIITYFIFIITKNRSLDEVATKNRKAVKMAKKRLKQAKLYLENSEKAKFYEELHTSLVLYISDKLNIDMSDFSKENIREILVNKGVDENLVGEFVDLLDTCEFARYAPKEELQGLENYYNTALDIITKIENSMKKVKTSSKSVLLSLIFLLSFVGFSKAETVDIKLDSLWDSGVKAYSEGHWQQAIDNFSKINKEGYKSATLYYNLANAYYKADIKEQAILYYERALKIDPSFVDARENLNLVNEQIIDKISVVPAFILKTYFKKISWLMSSNAWTIAFLITLFLFLASLIIFLLSDNRKLRISLFYLILISIVMMILTSSFAYLQKKEAQNTDYAIVTSTSTMVKTAPSKEVAKDYFLLHRGTKVYIIDKVSLWDKIKIADGREGWILAKDIEKI